MMQSHERRWSASLEQITPDILRFRDQTFYGEAVGCYLVRDSDQLIMIETPHFSANAVRQVEAFRLPTKLYLTHGATSVDGDRWQNEANIPLYLNSRDFDDEWLRASPRGAFDGDFQITPHVRALHLPDHSKGHTVYYDDRSGGTLFSGDAILLHHNRLRLDFTEAVEAKILSLQFERMLPFHYDTVLSQASQQVHEAIQRRRA